MDTAKKALTRQLERIPMDRELRAEVNAGIERLSDSQAAEQAARLQSALDDIPELLARLERARKPTQPRHDEKDEEIASLHALIQRRDEQIEELESRIQDLTREREELRRDYTRRLQEARERIDKAADAIRTLYQRLVGDGEADSIRKSRAG